MKNSPQKNYLPSHKNSYNHAMNILKKLLFSFEGKIGRADYIYWLAYSLLLLLVCFDSLSSGHDWSLFGWGTDTSWMIQYICSIFGAVLALWIFAAVVSKRFLTLGFSRYLILLAFLFPPLLLWGLKRGSHVHIYNGNVSLVDQVFFYVLIGIVVASVVGIYQIHLIIKIALVIVLVMISIALWMFGRDVSQHHVPEKIKYIGLDVWLDLFFVLIIVFFIRSFVLSPFQIIGPSMETTFHGGTIIGSNNYGDGEFILVDKMTFKFTTPKRGDVVVFSPRVWPEKRYLIKRILGTPGDTVKVENGFVFVAPRENPTAFIKLDESAYLGKNFGHTCLDYSCAGFENESRDFVVPEGRYFLLGDNRQQSLDARKCFNSEWCTQTFAPAQFVPISAISGRVALSLGHFDLFKQIFPYPIMGTLKQVVPFRWLNIHNVHTYPELK